MSGELKDVYDVMGGAQLKYREMKTELLQWYKTRMIGRRRQWRAEFHQATLRHRESLNLYCKRLQRMAQYAYPNNGRECAKQLRRRLLNTVPSVFVDRIERREEIKDVLKLKNKLTWGEIIYLAEQEDRKRRKAIYNNRVWNSVHQLWDKALQLTCHYPTETEFFLDKEVLNPQLAVDKNTRVNISQCCWWCGKNGHSEKECWLKKGACTRCGKMGHRQAKCPKYNSHRSALSRTIYSPKRSIALPSLIDNKGAVN